MHRIGDNIMVAGSYSNKVLAYVLILQQSSSQQEQQLATWYLDSILLPSHLTPKTFTL